MGDKSNNEMEQIQQGLEAFLEKELNGSDAPERGRQRTQPEEERDQIQVIGQTSRKEEGVRRPRQQRESQGRRSGTYHRSSEISGEQAIRREDYNRKNPVQRQQVDWGYEKQEQREADWEYENREQQEENWDDVNQYWQREDEDRYYESQPRQSRERTKRGRASEGREQVRGRTPRKENPLEASGNRERKRSKARKQVPQEDVQMAKKAPKSSKGQKKKKKHRLKKFLIITVALVALLGFGLYQLVGFAYGKMNYSEIASVTDLPMQEDGVVNILLIGNDSRENGEDGRSDAMILLSVSSKTKTIYMTSLLRDMYVEIPGHDNNRLNAAYSFGGAELLMETVEKNFDIPVNRYMLVNFEGFANLVDTVGGIELELTTEEIEYVNGYLVEYNMLTDRPQGTDNMDPSVSGLVHLNGPQALAYSRNRYLGTDFGRTDRQRKVLTAVIKKLPSVMLTNAGELMDGLLPNLTTNLTRNECFRLSLMAGKLLTYEIVADSIPQPGTYSDATIRKMAVLEIDFDANIRYLKEKLYGE